MRTIPVFEVNEEVGLLEEELMRAVREVIRSGKFIMGPNVAALESELAAYLDVKHAVTLNSGTDALVIALRSLGIGPGDEVLTTPFTFFATAEAISQVGAVPVFIDVEDTTCNIDPDLIEAKLTAKTKAILPVHLFGQAANMAPILQLADKHGLSVIEDVAQAFGGQYRGRKLGTLGDAGCYSFFPTKNLGAYGDGGLLATNDDETALTARKLRTHGGVDKYRNELLGYNSRLDEMQAAILRVKLPHIDQWNENRRRIADRYRQGLKGLSGIVLPTEAAEARHVYHQYTIRVQDGRRDALQQHLREHGISTMVYYPIPVHRLPVYRHVADIADAKLPVAERLAGEVLSLPIWPLMKEAEQARVIDAIREALER